MLGTPELLIILAIVVLVFGAKRIPELGKGLGEGIRSFKEGLAAKDHEQGDPKEVKGSEDEAEKKLLP